MPNVSANIDTFLRSADNAAARTNLCVPALAGDTFTGPIAINGGTVADSTPLLAISQTWNDGTEAFKVLTMAVTNTASKAYSATWADVSTLMDLECDGETKFAVIPKGSENLAMLRIGGSDGAHPLLKDSATGAIIFRRSDVGDHVVAGWLAGQIGVVVSRGAVGGLYPGVIGFSSTFDSSLAGGNASADAFFSRGAAAAEIMMGKNSATPIDQLFKGPNGVGTNIVGGDLSLAAGQSTGNATPALLRLQGTAAGSSGASAQSLADHLLIGAEVVEVEGGISFRLGNEAVAETPTATHTLILQDSTGTSYKVLGVPV